MNVDQLDIRKMAQLFYNRLNADSYGAPQKTKKQTKLKSAGIGCSTRCYRA